MKTVKKLIALTMVISLFGGQIHSQEYQEYENSGTAYCDSENASYSSATLAVGVVVVAAIVIAATTRHHDHGGGGNRRHSFSHAHCGD